MRLQNGYKIIYEKVVGDKKHLFAGKNSVPATDDVEVKFDSLTEDQVKAFKLIYEAGEGFKGAVERIPGEADQAFALTDGTATIFAGDDYKVAVPKPPVSDQSAVEQRAPKKAAKKVEVAEEVKPEEVVEPVEAAE